MKKISTILTVGLLLSVLAVMAQKNNKDKVEVEAIKAAIERETKAFFDIDYKAWMDSWVHAPYSYWSFAEASDISSFEGWKAIEIGFTDYFLTQKPSNSKIERDWKEIRIYGNGAYALFKQRVITDGVPGKQQTEIRILEKDKTGWKIVLVGVLKK